MNVRFTLTLLALLAAWGELLPSAQAQARSAPPLSRVARPARTDHAPKIDGTLDDPAWKTAPLVDNFLQKEPLQGTPATEKTEVRILYDSLLNNLK